jgi:hypothetical protein
MALTQIVKDGLGASLTATSEGGAVTTSVQQGLAKSWVNFNASGVAVRDSINIASITDNGVGTFSMNMSNAMGNDDYAMSGCAFHSGAGGFNDAVVISRDTTQVGSISTTVNPFYTFRVEGTIAITDCLENMILLHGDLA